MADFLYNGVRLPDINGKWEEAKQEVVGCKYALIWRATGENFEYGVYFTTYPWKHDSSGLRPSNKSASTTYRDTFYHPSVSADWIGLGGGISYLVVNPADVIWTSHEILYANSTEVYLEKSPDPVPVTPVQLNPTALLSGFFTGQAVKRMRK